MIYYVKMASRRLEMVVSSSCFIFKFRLLLMQMFSVIFSVSVIFIFIHMLSVLLMVIIISWHNFLFYCNKWILYKNLSVWNFFLNTTYISCEFRWMEQVIMNLNYIVWQLCKMPKIIKFMKKVIFLTMIFTARKLR